ncbi:MAG: phage major capsid protein [Eubacteriales bacterium]|nr:phage major capsid protein [Eubacteriales bacterium]
MATSTLTTVAEALKTYYQGPITKQLNEKSGPLYAALKKKDKTAVGNLFKFPLQYGRHGGIGARGENDDLPTPSARKHKMGEASVKNLYARIALTDKLLKGSKDNRMAFVDELTEQMANITVDANDMIRRNFCNDHSGTMGVVKENTTGTKVVPVTGNIEAFYEGQVVDILTDAATKTVSAKEIVDVDRDAGTITFADNVTDVLADQKIVLAGNYNLELTGLKEILTKDNSLYGINRATAKWFNPQVFDKTESGQPSAFDSLWMAKALKVVDNRVGETPSFFVCSDGVELAYVNEQNTYKRNPEIMKVDGGYKLISYNGVPITAEKYFMANTMALINLNDFQLAQLGDWDWLDADGAILTRIANKAAYEATMALYAELICKRPGGQAIITGIVEEG